MARIVDYQETTTPADNDILLIETEDGTRKVKKSVLLKAVLDLIGDTDISDLGDGTTTSAISAVNQKVDNLGITSVSLDGTTLTITNTPSA